MRTQLLFLGLCLFTINSNADDKVQMELTQLPGFNQDSLIDGWPTWLKSCQVFIKNNQAPWNTLCAQAQQLKPVTESTIREYFVTNFQAQALLNDDATPQGKITGYYEPLLYGSLKPSSRFRYPVYGIPKKASNQRLSRQQIESQSDQLEGDILLWVNNPYDLFFLHVQGSGQIELQDGRRLSLTYAGNNGHEYTAIGKILLERKAMNKDKISMQSLRQWLTDHSDKANEIMQQNQRYIFFSLGTDVIEDVSGPRGSLNIPLTPQRSIAIDPNKVLMGIPIWLDSSLPNGNHKTLFQRLVFAQDTGAAIKGRVRADVFFGKGKEAEYFAGHMNQAGRLFQFIPIVSH